MGANRSNQEPRRRQAEKRRALRARAIAHLGGKCVICGYNRCQAAFDMHHPQTWLKEFTISSRMTSWEAIKAEVEKTILLCANCHREVHDGLWLGYLETDPIGTPDAWDYAEDPE